VNFTLLKPSDGTQGQVISIRTDGQGLDPGSVLYLKLTTFTHESSSYQVFHFFYEELTDNFPISVTSKNLFLALAKSIAQTLNDTSCYVCRGANMGDHWLWEAKELDPQVPFNESAFPLHRTGFWLLKTSIIGNYCIFHQGKKFSTSVGELTCLGQKFYNDTDQETQWWGTPNHTEPQPHPLANFSNLKKAWDNLADIDWQAPRGLYWICERQAYTVLPRS
jgi:hypothetical protein